LPRRAALQIASEHHRINKRHQSFDWSFENCLTLLCRVSFTRAMSVQAYPNDGQKNTDENIVGIFVCRRGWL
jgi:hypothetical protein